VTEAGRDPVTHDLPPAPLPPGEAAAAGSRAHNLRSPTTAVLHGALTLLSTQPITWSATLLNTIYVPRYLTDRELGQYAVVIAIASVAGTVVTLGVSTALSRRVSERSVQATADASTALALVLILAVPVALGLAFLWPQFDTSLTDSGLLPIALTGMVLNLSQNILFAVLIGQERHGLFATINAATTFISAVAGVGVLLAGFGLLAYMIVGIVVTTLTTTVGWRISAIGFDLSSLRLQRMIRLAGEGLPFLGWNLSNRARGDAEVFLMAAVVSERSVGWWSAANRIMSIPVFIPTLVVQPLLPALTRCRDDQPQFQVALRRSLILVLMLTIPASIGLVSLAPIIPGLLGWAPTYESTVPLIIALGPHLPLVAVGMVLGTGLVALGRERQWVTFNATGSAISLGMYFLLIGGLERFLGQGALGAAVVRVISELMLIGGAVILLPRRIVDWLTLWAAIRVVAAGVILAAVVTVIRQQPIPGSIPLAVAGGAVSYALAILALRVVSRDELRRGEVLVSRLIARIRGRDA
jgi:O-antigen/teichoic acid export membrane protein